MDKPMLEMRWHCAGDGDGLVMAWTWTWTWAGDGDGLGHGVVMAWTWGGHGQELVKHEVVKEGYIYKAYHPFFRGLAWHTRRSRSGL